jgi:hypothetical protein
LFRGSGEDPGNCCPRPLGYIRRKNKFVYPRFKKYICLVKTKRGGGYSLSIYSLSIAQVPVVRSGKGIT